MSLYVQIWVYVIVWELVYVFADWFILTAFKPV